MESVNPWGINQQIAIALRDWILSRDLTQGQKALLENHFGGSYSLALAHCENVVRPKDGNKPFIRHTIVEIGNNYNWQTGKYMNSKFIPLPALRAIINNENIPTDCHKYFITELTRE